MKVKTFDRYRSVIDARMLLFCSEIIDRVRSEKVRLKFDFAVMALVATGYYGSNGKYFVFLAGTYLIPIRERFQEPLVTSRHDEFRQQIIE